MAYNIIMKARNYGIDLLRLLSMLFVAILHTLLISKLIVQDGESSTMFSAAWLLETLCYGAVNIFALISGYVGFREKEKPFKVGRLLSLWLQAVFYGVLVFVIYLVFKPELVSRSVFYKSVMPVTHQSYWYLTAFLALYLVMPVLNAAVRGMKEKQLKWAIWVALGVFSIMSLLTGDIFRFSSGYSFVWLAVLYFVGAAMKKSGFLNNVRKIWCLVGFLACSVIAWVFRVYGPNLHGLDLYINRKAFVGYTSPLIVFASVLLVSFFSRLQIKKRAAAVITCFAPCAFAVYLLNCNVLIWSDFLPSALRGMKGSGLGVVATVAGVLAFSVAFFIVAILVEKLRLIAIAWLKRGYGKIKEIRR